MTNVPPAAAPCRAEAKAPIPTIVPPATAANSGVMVNPDIHLGIKTDIAAVAVVTRKDLKINVVPRARRPMANSGRLKAQNNSA